MLLITFATQLFYEPFVLGSPKGGFYFDLFYLLAFVLATVWMLWEGHKRKIPWVSWLLVLAFTRLAFIVGTKINSYSAADWNHVFTYFEFPATSFKVVIGGFILGIGAFMIAIRLFRIPAGSLDALAIAVPFALAVQRIGCFLVGCCFGTGTDLPWGVRYGFGTLPHLHQFSEGLIEPSAAGTLPIHPFQLYEALNGILVGIFLLRFRKKVKSQGGLFLLSMGVWAFFRTGIEFFRDPFAHAMGGEILMGMKLMQWILLTCSVTAFLIFYYREKNWKTEKAFSYSKTPSQKSVWILLMLTVVLTWSLRNWLSDTELLAMNIMLFPAIALAAKFLFEENTAPSFRWATLTLIVLPIFLMSQTWEEKEKTDSTKTTIYDFFNLGYSSGIFYSQTLYNPSGSSGDGCGSSYDYETYKNTYWNAGIGYGRSKTVEKGIFTYGANGSLGQYTETMLDSTIQNKYNMWAISPYVRYDLKWVGFGFGLHLGNNYWADLDENVTSNQNLTTSTKKSPVYPLAYMRVGPEEILFVEGGFGNAFPSPFPGMRYEAAIGTGFGLPRGNKFRVGTGGVGTFIQAQVLATPSWQASVTYSWLKDHYFPGYYEELNNKQLFLGIQYRFNHKD
jgi:prolipoprotein diacylglyceryltransferase